jgi:hypothetical protein
LTSVGRPILSVISSKVNDAKCFDRVLFVEEEEKPPTI